MTHKERELLETIGRQVAGPRHKADVDAVPEVVALIESLIEQKLVESTDHVRRATTPFIRVCLTGKGGCGTRRDSTGNRRSWTLDGKVPVLDFYEPGGSPGPLHTTETRGRASDPRADAFLKVFPAIDAPRLAPAVGRAACLTPGDENPENLALMRL